MEVNLNTNLHFQFVYYLVLGLKISSHASRAQKASWYLNNVVKLTVALVTLNRCIVVVDLKPISLAHWELEDMSLLPLPQSS